MIRNANIRRGPPFAPGGQFQPPIQRMPFNRTIIPARTFDPLIITQLLLKAATENNLLELQKFINENGITTNDMINEEGQSILHLILLNLNLSKRQKLEMVRFFKNQGTLVSSFDKSNQTPLHIACKQQLHDVVLELINAGHDINAVDASYKTPLHYAVFGKTTDTPPVVDKKILPETKMKLKSELIPNITKKLVEYIDKTPRLRDFFENQYDTLQNAQKLYTKEIDNIINSQSVITKITDIIATTPDPALQQQKIFEASSDVNKSVKEFINAQLVNSKKQLTMEPNTPNGWGPDNIAVNKVLEYGQLSRLSETLTNMQTTMLQNINDKKTQLDTVIDALFTDLNNEKDLMNVVNSNALFVYKFCEQIDLYDDGTGTNTKLFNLTAENMILTDNQIKNNFLYITTIGFTTTKFDNLYTYGNIESFNQNNYTTRNIRNLRTTVNTAFTVDYNNYINNINLIVWKTPLTPSITNLLNDYDADIAGGVLDINGNPHIDTATIKATPFQTVIGGANVDTSFVTLKLTHILIELTNAFTELKTQLATLIQITNLPISDPQRLMTNLSLTIIKLISVINIFSQYYSQYGKVIKYYEDMKALLVPKNKTYVVAFNGNPHDIKILYDSLDNDYTQLISNMKRNENGQANIMFNNIKAYYDIIIDTINYYNTKSSAQCVINYFNTLNIFDTIMTNAQTTQYNNIIDNKIETLNSFFTSYTELQSFLKLTDIQADQTLNKTRLIEKFLLQLSQKNNYKIISSTLPVLAQSKIGFITGSQNVGGVLVPAIPDLTAVYDINLAELNLKYGPAGVAGEIDDADASKVGIYAVERGPKQFDKNKMALPVIGVLLDQFITIQKYLFTRFILNEIYKHIISAAPLAIPPGNNIGLLKDVMEQLNKEIIDNIKNDPSDKSIFMITVGKIIDKIFNANLENIINITTNNFAYRYNRNELMPRYELVNMQQYNKVDIININVNDVYKNIYRLIKQNRYLNLYNFAEDVMQKDKSSKKTYKLMSTYAGDNPVEVYMECDIDLIKLLINNGANINVKDKDGNTPLTIAIMNSNKDVVEHLLTLNTSVNSKKSKNRFGLKPLDFCVKNITVLIDNFENEIDEKAIKSIIDETNQEILKVTRINHNMRFNDIIIKMLIYLLNHDMYAKLNSYKHGLTKADHDAIFTKLTTQLAELPLLSNLDGVLLYTPKYVDEQINSKQKELQDATDKRAKIISEQNLLRGERKEAGTTNYRKDEISDRIIDNGKELAKLPRNIVADKKENNDLKVANTIENNTYVDTIKRRLQTINIVNNPLKMYDQITEKILQIDQNDYRTYSLLWAHLFNNKTMTKSSDPTQIINKIFEVLKTNLKDTKKVDQSKFANIMPIKTVFGILNNDIQNYFTLPVEYNGENYMLNSCLETIIHVVNHTMIINLYHVILKLLRNELESKIPQQDGEDDIAYNTKLETNMDSIINTTVNNINIKTYLFEVLGEKLVKVCLGIFEDESDPDKSTSIMNLLSFIDKILVTNTAINISRDSSKTLKLLNQHVYPYFKNYFEINIKKLKMVADNYLSMIMGFSAKIDILEIVLQKASKE